MRFRGALGITTLAFGLGACLAFDGPYLCEPGEVCEAPPDAGEAPVDAGEVDAGEPPADGGSLLQVVARFPGPGATQVDARGLVRVQFSEPLSLATLAMQPLTLRQADGGALGLSAVSLTDGGTVLGVGASPRMPAPSVLTAELSGAITSASGKPLEPQDGGWSFTVPSWLTSAQLASSDVAELASAKDAQGRVVVAWVQKLGASDSYLAARWDGQSWEPLGAVGTCPTLSEPNGPSVVIDGAGAPLVAYTGHDGTSHTVIVKRWDGAGWQPAGNVPSVGLDGGASADSSEPALALAPSGDRVLALRQGFGGTATARVLRATTGDFVQLGPSIETGVDDVALAVDAMGLPYVSLLAKGMPRVFSWNAGPSQWTALSGSFNGYPATATRKLSMVLRQDRPVIAFVNNLTPNQVEIFSWSGASWEEVGTPRSTPGVHLARPSLAVDAQNALALAYESGNDIFIRRWNGASWVAAELGFSPRGGAARAQAPALGFDALGRLLLSYRRDGLLFISLENQ